jgi:hypothetical protein
MMAASRATTSMSADPGAWKPKNIHDQAAFKVSWTANRARPDYSRISGILGPFEGSKLL